VLRLAREKPELAMVDDQFGSPTWARALAQATAELLRKQEIIGRHGGIYHLAAGGHASRFELANAIIGIMQELSGLTGGWAKVSPITTREFPLPARRPPHPVMSMEKIQRVFGVRMPHWREQLHGMLRELAKSTSLGV
jgi:dTDP-4-dehydrorhamnose reductase